MNPSSGSKRSRDMVDPDTEVEVEASHTEPPRKRKGRKLEDGSDKGSSKMLMRHYDKPT